MNLNEALAQLDPTNDEHWTADGLPRTDTVSNLMRRQVSRKEISEAAPELSRPSGVAASEAAESPVEVEELSYEQRRVAARAATVEAEAALNKAKQAFAEAIAAEDALIIERDRDSRRKPNHIIEQEKLMAHIHAHNERRAHARGQVQAGTPAPPPPSQLDGVLQASRKRPSYPGASDGKAE